MLLHCTFLNAIKSITKLVKKFPVGILLTILILNIVFISCHSAKEEGKAKKPNILFIMSDDHAYQAISAYSDQLIQTPNIDRIANEGMLFTNACVTNSICAPSRATILTGKHTHINGKIDNIMKFDTTQLTFPQLFQKEGYETAMYGKLHFGNNPKGVDDFMILPGQGSYINPKLIALAERLCSAVTLSSATSKTSAAVAWWMSRSSANAASKPSSCEICAMMRNSICE